jgi:NAD(P)H-hydrate epimerase
LTAQEAKSEFTDCYWFEKSDAASMLKSRSANSSKNDYGSVLLVAGSYGMMGAAQMAAMGALRAGAGRVTVHSPLCGFQILQTAVPEAMFQADTNKIVVTDVPISHPYNVIAVGPGLGANEYTQKAIEELVTTGNKKPMVLDADALNCIARRPSILESAYPLTILTPHSAEFDRMFGESTSNEARLHLALDRAEHYSVVILLKGNPTIIVRPDRKFHIVTTGTPALATPGSGDVLTGIISALLAQGHTPDIAAALGALIHGVAGTMAAERQGEYGVIARDIAAHIGPAIKEIMTSNQTNE